MSSGPLCGIWVLSAAAALAALSCGPETQVSQQHRPADDGLPWEKIVVAGSVVNLRAGPGTAYRVMGRAERGDTLRVTGKTESWLRVYDPSASMFVWIYEDLTSVLE